jgi:hypothetical protein
MTNLITGDSVAADSITLKPYQYAWLTNPDKPGLNIDD